MSYQEPGRSRTGWKQLKYVNTKMTEMLELPDTIFEAAMIIILQQAKGSERPNDDFLWFLSNWKMAKETSQ